MAAPEQPFVDPLAELHAHGRILENSHASRQRYAEFLQGKSPSELKWWSKDTIALVTGSNKGLGLEIVRRLAAEGITTILTSRDESRGLAAVEKLKSQGLGPQILFHPFDVTSQDSAAKLAGWVKETVGAIDLLVCNAGTGSLDINYEAAEQIVETNYFGARNIVSALLPLLRSSPAGPRILFIGSECGCIANIKNEKALATVSDIDRLSEEDLDALGREYLEDVKAGRQSDWSGTFFPMYNESKFLLHAYGRLLARRFDGTEGRKIYVNSCTPGFTSTDIVGNHPAGRTVENGADTPIWILLFPSGGPTGGFVKDRADCPF